MYITDMIQVEEAAEDGWRVWRKYRHSQAGLRAMASPTLVGWRWSKMFSLRVATALLAFCSCLYICVVGGMDGATAAFR